ncbi:MAG: hypothetical protein R3B47_01715 [Bacteroidia bacterium]
MREELFLPFEVGEGKKQENSPNEGNDIYFLDKNSAETTDEVVEVGRFRFFKSSFDHGNAILKKAAESDVDIIAFDEWGKLELRGKGFAEGAEVLVKKALCGAISADVVVVVRDYLLEDFYRWCESLIPKEEAVCWPSILDLPIG